MKFVIGKRRGETAAEDEEQPPKRQPLRPDVATQLSKILGYEFKDLQWLERALTHRSLQSKSENDYERLEFLGDAVLDLAVAHLLLEKHPQAREGELSKMRAALVNTASLAEIARSLSIGPYIRLSRGELANGGSDRPSILADVFEAIMGAIYREAGFAVALESAARLFGDRIAGVTPRDPKTELQEALHAAGCEGPEYLLEHVEGPEHAPTFVSVVIVDGQVVGRGRGNTKKASQQEAASVALARIQAPDEVDNVFLEAAPEIGSSPTEDKEQSP
ncbi:MAG: ribonuclease III [Bdellovibrionota bacterium]|nr:MAG: ribonuclease III [Bdellovibrionota bacterium]